MTELEKRLEALKISNELAKSNVELLKQVLAQQKMIEAQRQLIEFYEKDSKTLVLGKEQMN